MNNINIYTRKVLKFLYLLFLETENEEGVSTESGDKVQRKNWMEEAEEKLQLLKLQKDKEDGEEEEDWDDFDDFDDESEEDDSSS